MALFSASACVDSGAAELVFVEQEGGAASTQQQQTNSPLTSSSQLELNESSVEQIGLCVLPFANLSGTAELDYLSVIISQAMNNYLEDFSRVFNATLYSDEQYHDLLAAMGRSADQPPDEELADRIRRETSADIILFGKITIADNDVRIESFVMDFSNGFEIKPLKTKPVNLKNFVGAIDPYVQDLLDEIIAQHEG